MSKLFNVFVFVNPGKKASVFVTGKSLGFYLIFVSMAGAYLSGASIRWAVLWPYLQEVCQGKYSSLLGLIISNEWKTITILKSDVKVIKHFDNSFEGKKLECLSLENLSGFI